MKKTNTLCVLLTAFILQFTPSATQAQCTPVDFTNRTTIGSKIYVEKLLPIQGLCSGRSMNATCDPGTWMGSTTIQPVSTLFATASTMATNPSCEWVCSCGSESGATIRIDGSNGLPVELMEFSVGE